MIRRIRKYLPAILLVALAASAHGAQFTDLSLDAQIAALVNQPLLAADDTPEGFGNKTTTPVKPSNDKAVLTGKKSLIKAGLYSALLPGLGEHYVGYKKKARYFFALEALTWIGFASQHIYSNWKQEDMRKYAADYAGANLEDSDKWFEDMVGFYSDINSYNMRGRVDDPDRPYLVDNATNHWSWTSPDAQDTYRGLKNSYREANRRAEFMIGLAVVSRIVSVIDAVRDARRVSSRVDPDAFSSNDDNKIKFRVDIDPFDFDRPVGVTLYREF